MPGPVGKRSTERHGHRTKAEQAVDIAPGSPPVAWPEPDPQWHDVTRMMWDAIPESGQVGYFEPSDVAAARYAIEAMDVNLKQGKFSAMLFAQVWSALGDLCVTEGARRRLRIELEKPVAENEEQKAAVASLSAARQRLGAAKAK